MTSGDDSFLVTDQPKPRLGRTACSSPVRRSLGGGAILRAPSERWELI